MSIPNEADIKAIKADKAGRMPPLVAVELGKKLEKEVAAMPQDMKDKWLTILWFWWEVCKWKKKHSQNLENVLNRVTSMSEDDLKTVDELLGVLDKRGQ